jgi:AcrR family transcriptional regulator
MPKPRRSSRHLLIETAKELFVRQGITQTTTRQIADAAGVNEVTLFRNFGTKQGLLLAVFADLGVFAGETLQLPIPRETDWQAVVQQYAATCFQALVDNPELVRSVVGEAGLYSEEHRQALQLGFRQAQEQLASFLRAVDPRQDPQNLLQAAGALHVLILGAAVMQVTAGLPALVDLPEEPHSAPLIWLQASVAQWFVGLGGGPGSR